MLVDCSLKSNPGEFSRPENRDFPLGNSERIRSKFGSYGIEILENSPGIRVSSLYSTQDGVRINRTFAVVAYPEIIDASFQKEHEAIINGQSIGILFRQNGWTINKQHLYFSEIDVPSGHFVNASGPAGNDVTRSAIHVYSLLVKKGRDESRYASIAEVHHPEYLQLNELERMYGADFERHLHKEEQVGDFLEIIKSRIRAL